MGNVLEIMCKFQAETESLAASEIMLHETVKYILKELEHLDKFYTFFFFLNRLRCCQKCYIFL